MLELWYFQYEMKPTNEAGVQIDVIGGQELTDDGYLNEHWTHYLTVLHYTYGEKTGYQIIGTYTAAAKYLFPAIGYAVAAMTVICGLFIIQSHMTGAFVTGHVVCGLGLITACVSTAATSSTRFSLIPKNSGDSTFSVNPAGFTRGQSSLLIFIVSAIAAGAWVWCILLFALGTLPAHIVAGSVMFGIACVCTSLFALVASIARQARGS